MANDLKGESEGLLNLFRTGTFAKTALNLFDRYNKAVQPEMITENEIEWLEGAKFKAMIFCDKYDGKGHEYDFNSFYPWILRGQSFPVPIKEGTYHHITSLKKGIDVGICKCIIHKSEDELINKLFVFNRNNYYTHFDLMLARELDLTIELSTVKPNAIIWGRSDYLRGEQVFTKYVDLLFDLKLKKIPGSKDILNVATSTLLGVDCSLLSLRLSPDFEFNNTLTERHDQGSTSLITLTLNYRQ
jgi:hypothetical protein